MANMYEIISKKRDGSELTKEDIKYVIKGYINDKIPDYQVSALLMAVYLKGFNSSELTELTQLMLESGDKISLEIIPGKKIDKHSTGGVGDKVSFIVAPIVAACGVKVPMLSGRALGHTGGTLDKLESIPGMNVFLDTNNFRNVLNRTGMVICGQTANIVPADKKLYSLRDSTATVSSIPLISSSIMSKKLALLSDGIVLDVKTGKGAFIPKIEDSIELCKTMVEIGESNGRRTVGLITGMDQPLGNCVGNSLEIIESVECLKGNGPDDLMEVTFALGAAMLVVAEMVKSFKEAYDEMKQAIDSGRALNIFRDFIAMQGGDPRVCDDYTLFGKSQKRDALISPEDGIIKSINAYEIGMAAIETGAGRKKKEDKIDHTAGFVLKKKSGQRVKKGDIITEIHCGEFCDTGELKKRLSRAIEISDETGDLPPIVHSLVDRSGVHPWETIIKQIRFDLLPIDIINDSDNDRS